MFLKSIHFCSLPLPLLSQSCQLLLSEPLGGLFIDHWNMVPALHLSYLCPLIFDWLWKCTTANFFLPPSLSHALKSSHCLPLQPMHLNFIWSHLSQQTFLLSHFPTLITVPLTDLFQPHTPSTPWTLPVTSFPGPLLILFSPLQCSIFILSPFFNLINADSLYFSS